MKDFPKIFKHMKTLCDEVDAMNMITAGLMQNIFTKNEQHKLKQETDLDMQAYDAFYLLKTRPDNVYQWFLDYLKRVGHEDLVYLIEGMEKPKEMKGANDRSVSSSDNCSETYSVVKMKDFAKILKHMKTICDELDAMAMVTAGLKANIFTKNEQNKLKRDSDLDMQAYDAFCLFKTKHETAYEWFKDYVISIERQDMVDLVEADGTPQESKGATGGTSSSATSSVYKIITGFTDDDKKKLVPFKPRIIEALKGADPHTIACYLASKNYLSDVQVEQMSGVKTNAALELYNIIIKVDRGRLAMKSALKIVKQENLFEELMAAL